MNDFWNVIWPNRADRAAATRILSIGALAAAVGASIAFFMASKTLLQEGFGVSGVLLPICAGALLVVAAFGLHRRAPNSAALAVAVWIALGVAPIGIPLWLGFVVLLVLVSAARGSYVLRRLT